MVVVDEWEKEQPRGEIKKEYGGHRKDEYTSYGFGRVALRGGEHFSFVLCCLRKKNRLKNIPICEMNFIILCVNALICFS